MAEEEKKQVPEHHDEELEAHENEQVLSFLREYGTPIMVGVVAAVVIYLGFVFYRAYQRNLAERAAGALAAAQNVEQLQKVVNQYGSTPSGSIAMLALGANYLHSGQYALARDTYERFRTTYPEHEMLAAAALGVAYAYEAEGRLDEAATRFEAFEKEHPDHYLTPMAVFGRARCMEQSGRYAEAKAVYEDFVAANPENSWVPQAETAMLYLERELRRN
jgi:TolA-binding protein